MGDAIKPVQAEALLGQGWLVHGFSTRTGGTSAVYGRPDYLNLGFTAHDSSEAVRLNRQLFLEHLDGGTALVTIRQVHGAEILRVSSGGLGPDAEADGLITDEAGLLLGIQTADCVPVLVADPRTRTVGAFHAGWRGTADRIVEQGIRRMCEEFGSAPETLRAAIGPSIGPCCYQVGEEVAAVFQQRFGYGAELLGPGRTLNLKEGNRRQLLAAGVRRENISVVEHCTSCEESHYFSHRAQAGRTGRMLSVIGIRMQPEVSG